MEALYSKLYDKYTKLKKEKFSEQEERNKNQEVKFVKCISVADELINHLQSENFRLRGQINDLRSEMTELRNTMDEKCAEYQKLLIEENHTNKLLSEEVERFQKLQQEGLCLSSKDDKYDGQNLPALDKSPKVSTRSAKKRRRSSGAETEEDTVMAGGGAQNEAMAREPVKDLSKIHVLNGDSVIDQPPKCCSRAICLSGVGKNASGPNCLFQALIEYIVGMKLSITQTEGVCVSAQHQSSGYSFSLTWLDKAAGESELLYRVSSLGTFERVAPEWMKEVLMFSMSMCPVFFERVARVIKLHH